MPLTAPLVDCSSLKKESVLKDMSTETSKTEKQNKSLKKKKNHKMEYLELLQMMLHMHNENTRRKKGTEYLKQ